MVTLCEMAAVTRIDSKWDAVLARDRRQDGRFVYAVRSTGIYCRPSCPSRKPRRENVDFFASPAAAEREGFRACRRCDPTQTDRNGTNDQQIVARVRRLIEQADAPPSLDELARGTGVAAQRLRDLFTAATGLSP